MNKDNLFAFYGTLRKGMENHILYGKGMRYVETVQLNGYKLYSLGDEYPYAVISDTMNDRIVAELFHITDRDVATAIHDMEIDAGYDYHEIDVHGKIVGIYLFATARPGDTVIVSGDWVEFVTQN